MFGEIRRDRVFQVFIFGAVLYWALAIVGGIRAYSPVPFWDMWDGYLGFFVKVSAGDWSAWWAQHNEHRIVLARVLFWIDLAWLGGAGWFLLLVNYIFLALACFIFWSALKENCPKNYRFFGLFLIIWLSSWSQANNLTWGFQSQFILAQLLPLAAFFILHRAVRNHKSSRGSFITACFLGVLSLGTMANGVLALPLMTIYAAITRMGWRRVVILAVLSCLGLLTYFHNYHSPGGHGSVFVALRENPLGLLRYVLLYVGGPFYFITGKGSIIVAEAAGALLIAASVYLAWESLRKIRKSSREVAMLVFILYVGGTALGTAGGRLLFGAEQALSSRYMTPALMAWGALLVILAPKVIRLTQPHRRKVWIPLLGLSLVMLPMQLTALQSQTAALFERDVAALSLEMRIKDQRQIGQIYPSAEWALSLTEVPSTQNLSIFGEKLFKDVREQIGQERVELSGSGRSCHGFVDGIELIEENSQFMRIHGWLFDQERKAIPKSLWIVGHAGKIFGYVLLGQPRPDVAAVIDQHASNAGFKGYFLTEAQGLPVTLFDPESKCTLPVTLPPNDF